jgi:tRNA nucleotidyltransferase (CCA-adding enzyme)
MHLPEYIKRILDVYSAAGYRALAVGGCVRDTLLGAEPDDYDIATDALPHETKELFKAHRIIETGIKHGTLTIMCEDHPVEVTVFRKDGAYTDNRRPDSVTFSRTFAEDAAAIIIFLYEPL